MAIWGVGDWGAGSWGGDVSDYKTIDTGIKSMIQQLTGLDSSKIVLANQNGPRPDLPFISFERISEQAMQISSNFSATETTNARSENVKRSVIRLQAHSNTNRQPFELLDDCVMGVSNFVVMDDIRNQYGFNVLNYNNITDISAVMTQHYEYRAFIDFTITYREVKEFIGTAGCFIEDVSGSGVLKDATLGDRNITFNVNT